MKKFFAVVICTVILLCAFPVCAFAEGESVDGIEQTEVVTDTSPTTEETTSEGEILGEKAMPDITTDLIVDYIKVHFEEISVVITLILTAFYNVRKHRLLNRSISFTNNNAIAVSENSNLAMQEALAKMEAFSALQAEYRASAEEKKRLEKTLDEAMACIKASKLANIEFANELAELLVLANIPNSKKEELYSRHISAVNAIAEAEQMEVTTDDGGSEA